MSSLLEQSRLAFGAAPRSGLARDDLVPPVWMKPDDGLRASYGRIGDLLENGDVIWGYVVQANVALFRPGDETSPAQVLFGARADEDLSPERLRGAAHAAMAFKGRTLVDPALRRVAEALEAENERHPVLDLPDAITHGSAVRMAMIMVHRVSLPSRRLSSLFVPLLADRTRDHVTIFPARYWSEDLVRGWYGLAGTSR